VEARPEDLLIAIKAKSKSAAKAALGQLDTLLTRRRSAAATTYRPRSLDAAFGQLPQARWALISIPGRYAAEVSRQVLEAGRHVFLYSDNVSIEDEIALKHLGRESGLLVMGPDCGTAIVNGIGFGFANRVRRGRIGLVGASGTGLQAITTAVHGLGEGISHALGTGGRDLKGEVGAICARQALDLLARDPSTDVIAVVSKPPDPNVAASLLAAARQTGKPTVINFIGYAAPTRQLDNLHFTQTLQESAEQAVVLLGSVHDSAAVEYKLSKPQERIYLRGLFSGGTLAIETVIGFVAMLGEVYTNVSGAGASLLADPLASQGHTVLDLGEDVFTVGRLHPMIDNDLRIRRMRQEAADPQVAILLLDVVLGDGAHPDPASELAPVIGKLREEHHVDIAVLLVGTDEDPQGLGHQQELFEAVGATVFTDTMSLVSHAVTFLGPVSTDEAPGVSLESLTSPVAAINIGLETFFDSLSEQGADVVQVDWRPPAGGDERMMDILAKMKSSGSNA
jgi:FdrA protein